MQDETEAGHVPDVNSPFRVAEYTALRDEIQRRSERQHQFVTLTIVVAGTLFTLGLQRDVSAAVAALLVYPVLGMFFATAWGQHDTAIGHIGGYIRERIEKYAIGSGWQTYIRTNNPWQRMKNFVSAEQGLFLTTELGALLLAEARLAVAPPLVQPATPLLGSLPALNLIYLVLLLIDVAAIWRTRRALQRAWERRHTRRNGIAKDANT